VLELCLEEIKYRDGASNYGKYLSLVAPDGIVVPTYLVDNTGNASIYKYLMFWGTSCAAPYVASVAAILKFFDPQLTPEILKELLIKTASNEKIKNYSKWEYGAGVVDIGKAFKVLLFQEEDYSLYPNVILSFSSFNLNFNKAGYDYSEMDVPKGKIGIKTGFLSNFRKENYDLTLPAEVYVILGKNSTSYNWFKFHIGSNMPKSESDIFSKVHMVLPVDASARFLFLYIANLGEPVGFEDEGRIVILGSSFSDSIDTHFKVLPKNANTPPNQGCSIEYNFSEAPFGENIIDAFRKVRDSYLAKVSYGLEAINLYYEWSSEFNNILDNNPDLKEEFHDIIYEIFGINNLTVKNAQTLANELWNLRLSEEERIRIQNFVRMIIPFLSSKPRTFALVAEKVFSLPETNSLSVGEIIEEILRYYEKR